MIRRVVVTTVFLLMSAIAHAQSFCYPGSSNTIP